MRIRRWTVGIALVLALLASQAVFADSPVGKWSGRAKGGGLSMSASASFSAGGSCSLTAGGVTASGSWSGGTLRVSAMGHSATLSYSVNGNKMTISGTYSGRKGTMSLTRTSGGEESDSEANGLYGHWTGERDAVAYDVRLYQGGWLMWTQTEQGSAGGSTVEYGAALKAQGGKLTLKPLEEGAQAPALWNACWDEDDEQWVLPYALEKDALVLLKGSEQALTLTRQGDVDKKPEHALFMDYVEFKRGDRGEAVRALQEALIAQGYLADEANAADGIFGQKTQAALKKLQKALDLTADGVAGPQVRKALAQS